MTNEVPDHMLGTDQYRDARDISGYLVHMTRSAEDLGSIIASGHIEARNRFGLGRSLDAVSGKHASACFTEMPLSELARLRDRGKPYGIAFKREFVLGRGGQRVWYVDGGLGPHRAIYSMKESAFERRDWADKVWDITPFVDECNSKKNYVFDWEREWRVVGGMTFELEDVALVIGLEGLDPLFEQGIMIGAPFYNARDDVYEWADEGVAALGENLEVICERFLAEFMTPDDAGLWQDPESPEEDGYWWEGCATRYETEDAIAEVLEELPEGIREALAVRLNQVSFVWVSREENDRNRDEEDNIGLPVEATGKGAEFVLRPLDGTF